MVPDSHFVRGAADNTGADPPVVLALSSNEHHASSDSARAVKIAHVATLSFPSRETDTEQIVRSFDAVAKILPNCELVVPMVKSRTPNPENTGSAIRSHYGIGTQLRITGYAALRPVWFDAQRIIHALLASRFFGGYDLVHTRSRGVLILCLLRHQPVVFETYRQLNHTNPFFARLLQRLSPSHFFKGIICHSRLAAQSTLQLGVSAEKIAILHNGFERNIFDENITRESARWALDIPKNRPVVLYAGNVQKGKGMEQLLAIAAERPQYDFLIVGGKKRDIARLEAMIRSKNLQNLQLKGWVHHHFLGRYLIAADVLIIPPSWGPLKKYRRTVLPIKTFMYLGAGRPILAPATDDLEEVLKDGENALLVPPDNIPAASKALDRLFKDSGLRLRLSQNATKKAADLDWTNRARKFVLLMRHWLDADSLSEEMPIPNLLSELLPFSSGKAPKRRQDSLDQ